MRGARAGGGVCGKGEEGYEGGVMHNFFFASATRSRGVCFLGGSPPGIYF